MDFCLLYSDPSGGMHWHGPVLFVVLAALGVAILLLQDRKRKRRREQWIADLKAGEIPPVSLENEKNGTISLQANGFRVAIPRREDSEAAVDWDQVEEIRAFKRDLFATDLVCWGFRLRGADAMVVLSEEMLGFRELQKAVESHFGIREKDWWRKVAFPAFAENMTVIWPVSRGIQTDG